MIHYLVPAEEEYTIQRYLEEEWGIDLAPRIRIVHYEDLPGRTLFDPGTYILSGLEHLDPPMLRLVAEVRRQLMGRTGFRVLNDPARTMRRFELLTTLYERGLNAFRAVRASGNLTGLRFPVFLRSERWHHGASSPLLYSARELRQAIGRALIKEGVADLLVVEFCDTVRPDGMYSKFSAYIVGDRIVPRCHQRAPHWMVKFGTGAFSHELAYEEQDYIAANPHGEQLERIRAISGVEYGRIDFGLLEGRVQTWEINLNPTPGRGRKPLRDRPPDVEAIRRVTKRRFHAALHRAFEAADIESAGPSVQLDIAPEIARDARSRPARALRTRTALVRLMKPARPVLKPIAEPLLPLVGRLARLSPRARKP